MNTLICAEDLEQGLSDPNWLVIDCRFSLTDENQGFVQYQEQHIKDAIYAHLNRDLSGEVIPGKTGRHPLPPRDKWIDRVIDWGINPDRQVIAYDDMGGAFAARLWWLLRWIGHEQVAVLDGGWQQWLALHYPVGHGIEQTSTGRVRGRPYDLLPSLTRQVSIADLTSGNIVLLDARDEPRYRGEVEPIDPVAGHIPGALCYPFSGNLASNGLFRSRAELKHRFSSLGTELNSPTIACYCGSGVTAAHNILAMVHAGFEEPVLYPGSWSEWICDPQRPVER